MSTKILITACGHSMFNTATASTNPLHTDFFLRLFGGFGTAQKG